MVDELKEAVGLEAFGRIIGLYADESTIAVKELREAVTSGDTAAVARRSHTLHTSSATVGATAVAAVCRQLETGARQGVLDGFGELVGVLAGLHASSLAALQAEREGGAGSR